MSDALPPSPALTCGPVEPLSSLRPTRGPDELLSAVARGDSEAFESFYDLFAGGVLTMALRDLPDPAEAEEATASVFLEAWARAALFDPAQGSAQAWLFTMTRRTTAELVLSAPGDGMPGQRERPSSERCHSFRAGPSSGRADRI